MYNEVGDFMEVKIHFNQQLEHENTTQTINVLLKGQCLKKDDLMVIQTIFEDEPMMIQIKQKQVKIKHKNNQLRFHKDVCQEMLYDMGYGRVLIETEVLMLDVLNDGLKMVYKIKQNNQTMTKGTLVLRIEEVLYGV